MTRASPARGTRTPNGLEQRFIASAREFPPDYKLNVIVGFSGGKDSLALAHLIARTKPITGIEARLVHVNHNLRPESKAQAKEAKSLAKVIGLPFANVDLEKGLSRRHRGVGVEEAARRERYLALTEHARRRRTDMLVLGHHVHDQAETVLMHLLRGSGIAGMSGMDKVAPVVVPWWVDGTEPKSFQVWRPLIEEDPSELAVYVAACGFEPIEDESNKDVRFRRNAVRHNLLPAIESVQPGGSDAIARFASIAAMEDQFIVQVTLQALEALHKSRLRIDIDLARTAHPAILRRVLKIAIGLAGATDASFDRIEEVRKLINEEPSDRVIQISGNCIAVSDWEWLYFGPETEVWNEVADVNEYLLAPSNWKSDDELPLKLDQRVTKHGISIKTAASLEELGRTDDWIPTIPAAALNGNLVLRRLAPGDKWAKAEKSVREWLRVEEIPPIARGRMLAVASEHGVWWIPDVTSPKEVNPKAGEEIVYVHVDAGERGDEWL
jgi:tRNA(Ile)-lysidine synthase